MDNKNTGAVQKDSNDGMFLRQFKISNFRSCRDTVIILQPDITVLVGENNAGKSNIIEALRLATMPLSRRRTRYFERDDFYDDSQAIELTMTLSSLTKLQLGLHSSALDIDTLEAWYSTRFRKNEVGSRRSQWELLSGNIPSLDQEIRSRELINHVYLAPLRDAQRELDSAGGSRLIQIVRDLIDPSIQNHFMDTANTELRQLESHELIVRTNTILKSHVTDLTDANISQDIGIGFNDFDLRKLIGGLRLKMAEAGLDLADIASSGLGYANLVFMATVIIELRNAKDAELTLFLVEEPEAHLHPQLQSVLLGYLRDQAEASSRNHPIDPAGRIQVVATTHSSNICGAVGTEKIVVIKRVNPLASQTLAARKTSSAIALANIPMTPIERVKVDQYLDVTKAQLLFSQRPILVEGIAEAIIIPAIGEHCLDTNSKADRSKLLRKLRSLSIVAVGSVDFVPYIKLLLFPVDGVCLVDHLIVVTDRDPEILKPSESSSDNIGGIGEARIDRTESLYQVADEIGSRSRLTVCEARFTLEADLMEPFDVNGPLLKKAFLAQKPRSSAYWEELSRSKRKDETFYRKLDGSDRYIRKGQFAHDVAWFIRKKERFESPSYLICALEKALES